MTIEPLNIGRQRVLLDPCNRNVTQRNWGALQDIINNISEKIEEVVNVININDIGDTTTIINTIINHNTFVTQVNNLVDNRITNYFNALYANTIYFTLNADLTLQSGTWQAQAAVVTSWLGAAPPATVTVIDPAAKWRWMAPKGAKGVAIRANEAGTLYMIMDIETIPPLIRFVVKENFATTDEACKTDNIDRLFVERINPRSNEVGVLWGTSDIYISNPPVSSGGYRFAAEYNDRGEAALIYKDTKPANTSGDPAYQIIQLECGN